MDNNVVGVSRKKEKVRRSEVGPLIEWIEKPLIPYGRGTKKNYYAVTLPEEFTNLNSLPIAKKRETRVYYSRDCKGFLLLSLGQWPALVESEGGDLECELKINDIKQLMGETDFTSTAFTFLREVLFARIEQGYKRIIIQADRRKDLEAVYPRLDDIISEVGMFAHMSRKTGGLKITISVEDDPKKIDEIQKISAFDFQGLTAHMWSEAATLFDSIVSGLLNLRRDSEDFCGSEAYIDFLWAYNCRQLIRAGRYGLFCGLGRYTSIHPVALGSFFKLLEHAVYQLMGIERAIRESPREEIEESTREFITKLIAILRTVQSQFKEIEKPFMNAINNNITNGDMQVIARILKDYQNRIKPQTGSSGSESYLGQFSLLGEFESTLKAMNPKQALFLSQVIYPLQKLAKFPANVAMLARILFLPTAS